MRTLTVTKTIGQSLLGSAHFSSKFPAIPIGKCAPIIEGGEDARALVRCGFLDQSVPIEVNLLNWEAIQRALLQTTLLSSLHDIETDPRLLISGHAIVGSIPPEAVSSPNSVALRALYQSGPVAKQFAELRLKSRAAGKAGRGDWKHIEKRRDIVGDSTFWDRVQENQPLYACLLGELQAHAKPFAMASLAPPVPPLDARYAESPSLQAQLNLATAELTAQAARLNSSPSLLYSFHVMPSAFRSPDIIREAVQSCDAVLTQMDRRFVGIHLAISRLGELSVSKGSRIQLAKDLVDEVVKVGSQHGMFVLMSNAGLAGLSRLDSGVSFATYRMNGAMGAVYPIFATDPNDPPDSAIVFNRRFGQVFSGPYSLHLMSRADLKSRDWKLPEDNGKTPRHVPRHLWGDPELFRVEFGKPTNVGVFDKLNELRDRELVRNGNARPGMSAVARSGEPSIRIWGK